MDANGTANNDSNAGSTSPAITGTTTLSVTAEWLVAGLFTASTGGTPSAWSDSFVSAGTNNGGGGTALLTVADEVVSAEDRAGRRGDDRVREMGDHPVRAHRVADSRHRDRGDHPRGDFHRNANFGKKAIGSAALIPVLDAADLI